MHKLRTISVGGYVDKVFATGYRPRVSWLTVRCTKNDQLRFPGQLVHFPTIAVGVPVDKLLVKGYSPLITWSTGSWLKIVHPVETIG